LLAAAHGHAAGAPEVPDGELTLALEAAGFDEQTLETAREQVLRDLDGMLALLGAGS
jgi:hypothetical protein